MTADEIDMEPRNVFGMIEYLFAVRDGSSEMKFSIYKEDADFIFSKNIEDFTGIIKDELKKRADAFWDDSAISDVDYTTFLKILELIL